MKIFSIFLLCIFFFIEKCLPNYNTIIHLNTLPAEGILLDKGWKFYAGDNQEFSKPEFDDSNCKNIDPTLDLYYLPQLKQTAIGWLRVKFHVDSGLLNKPIAFKIYQSIASEVYLNGKILVKYGTIGNDKLSTIAYRPDNNPESLIFTQTEQVLAVKFATQKNLLYPATTHPYYAFRFRIGNVQQSVKMIEVGHKYPFMNVLWAGIFLTLSIIHLGIFFQYRNRKSDFYFSLAMISIVIVNLLYYNLLKGGHTLSFISWAFLLDWMLLTSVYNILLYLAIHHLFSLKRNIQFWTVIFITIAGIVFYLYSYENGQFWGLGISLILTYIIALTVAWKEIKKGRKEVFIIGIGFSIYVLINICFSLFYAGYIKDVDFGFENGYSLMDLLYLVSTISVPFTLSFFLSRDFASTSRNLQNKLKEVQYLSEKSIRQEKEKQQILSSQKEILEQQVLERTIELEQSLENIKATQSQLIQSEKMASLGELTAGIAHEIQNPLNFVNNFSDLNKELIDELKEELAIGNSQLANEIADDIKANEQKINSHGKRAADIVKGMLQHSRTSTGQKEPTDINALADEYLRLAYHGLRAKDKSFNAEFKTDFDPTLPKINVIPQDIGRVLLNLINNAFYAVTEQSKLFQSSELWKSYQPLVSVSTIKLDDRIQISVKDNGPGIPPEIKNKIFQPFFTTKPTGQGTGLGLSLSYDIVKAHGGELKVETKEGEGTEFIIQLPIP
jgi:signal transduction histidine kinase